MAVRQPVTLIQVAENAGVSIATVSRVLNRRGQVDEHTRRRVMTSVETLGYNAGMIARKREIRTERPTYDVELLLCPLAEQKNLLQLDFMAEVLRGIQSFFSRHADVRMNICTWEPDEVLRLSQVTGLAEMFADKEFSEAWEPAEGDLFNDSKKK